MRKYGISALAICVAGTMLTQARADLIAHYRFDENGGTVLHDRSPVAQHGKIIGAAWVGQDKDAALDFDGVADVVDCGDAPKTRAAGPLTFTIWLRRNKEKQEYVVNRGGWNLYLLPNGRPVLETRTAKNDAWDSLVAPTAVPLNQWAHVAAVYDTQREMTAVYVNGKLSAEKKRTDGAFGGLFRAKLYLGKQLDGLIGEFRLYDRALSGGEIMQLYANAAPNAALTSPARRLRLKPHSFFGEGKIIAEVRLSQQPDDKGKTSAEVILRRPGQATPLRTHKVPSLHPGRPAEVVFATDGLAEGEYEVDASARSAAGALVAHVRTSVHLPKRPWWYDSAAGADEKVLPPFTPLTLDRKGDDLAASCWGRQYALSPLPFPQRVVTAGKDVLAAPIALHGKVDGAALVWKAGTLQVEQDSAARMQYRSSSAAEGLDLTATTLIEYDGLVRVRCRINPRRAVKIETLTLDLPLRREHAKLVYYCRDARFMASGAVPAAGLKREFNPAIWLGDEDRGLQWLCESDRNWYPANDAEAIEIAHENDRVVLRLHLVGRPITLAPDARTTTDGAPMLEYEFGFQATPIKPVLKDAWDYRVASCHKYGADYAMTTDTFGDGNILDHYASNGVRTVFLGNWTDVLSYPGPINHEEDLRGLVKACHERNLQVLLYLGSQFSELAPEYGGFFEDFAMWTSAKPYSWYGFLDNYPPMRAAMTYVPCVRSQWRNFIIANAERLLDDYDVDGFYLDGVGVAGQCFNPHHGCGYQHPDGTLHPRHPIWAGRDIIRRLYQLVKSRKPEGQIDLHPGSYWLASTMAWTTNVWDGETILGEDRKGANPKPGVFLLEYLPLDMFRAQFMGKPWGVSTEFLDYYVPYPYERQFAVTLLHDVTMRPHNTLKGLGFVGRLWSVMEDFGRKEAEWLPYWRNEQYVRAEAKTAYVSLYRHPTNGVLAVVSNLHQKPAEVRVRFDVRKLGLLGPLNVTDAMSGERLTISEGLMAFNLDSVDWRLVRIQGRK